jgi:S1-C subfamily serine protease
LDAGTPARSLSEPQSSSILSAAQIVARAKPAVVRVQAAGKSGSGSLVPETGLIVTNAHLARDQESLLAVFATGQQLEAKVVYVDPHRDQALVKVDGAVFPYLSLALTDTVRQGDTVIAIGNPAAECRSALPEELSAASENIPALDPVFGFRRTPLSIPGIVEVLFSTYEQK